MTCTLNPIKPTWQALRHLPLAIQMSLAMTLIGYLIILADREHTLGTYGSAVKVQVCKSFIQLQASYVASD